MGKQDLSYWVSRWEILERRAAFWLAIFRINPTYANGEALASFYSARAEATMAALMALTLSPKEDS
jgi:hypothetical protein